MGDYLFGDENKIVWIKVVDLSFFTSLERNKEQLSRIEDKSEKSSQPAFDNYEKIWIETARYWKKEENDVKFNFVEVNNYSI